MAGSGWRWIPVDWWLRGYCERPIPALAVWMQGSRWIHPSYIYSGKPDKARLFEWLWNVGQLWCRRADIISPWHGNIFVFCIYGFSPDSLKPGVGWDSDHLSSVSLEGGLDSIKSEPSFLKWIRAFLLIWDIWYSVDFSVMDKWVAISSIVMPYHYFSFRI